MKTQAQRLIYKFYRNRLGIVAGVFTIGVGLKYTLESKLNLYNIDLYLGVVLLIIGAIFIIRSPKSNRYRR